MFNGGRQLSPEQERLIGESLSVMQWLGTKGVKFEPIYSRQSFEKDGRHVFWGGLTLAAENEGVGLFEMELATFTKMGGEIRYDAAVTGLQTDDGKVTGVMVGEEVIAADAVILARHATVGFLGLQFDSTLVTTDAQKTATRAPLTALGILVRDSV